MPKLARPEDFFFFFFFFLLVIIDILSKYFSFLPYERSIQPLYEILDALKEALAAFTVRES